MNSMLIGFIIGFAIGGLVGSIITSVIIFEEARKNKHENEDDENE